MERRKLTSAALVLTLLGALLFMPPLAMVFQLHRRVLGVPAELIYLFVAWVLLLAATWWLSRRLPREGEDES